MKRSALMCAGIGLLLAGCHTDLWTQQKTGPLEESKFFEDGLASRPLVEGTVARGHLRADDAFFRGRDEKGKLITQMPIAVTKELVERGQERFNAFCSPCHGRLGDGNGMISQRGFAVKRPPASYHTDRLRQMPVGHFYDVITNGYGAMYPYASRVEPEDRWAITAYIRALQLSQNGKASDVPAEEMTKINNPQAAAPAHGGGH